MLKLNLKVSFNSFVKNHKKGDVMGLKGLQISL